jgi:hypothetical protein
MASRHNLPGYQVQQISKALLLLHKHTNNSNSVQVLANTTFRKTIVSNGRQPSCSIHSHITFQLSIRMMSHLQFGCLEREDTTVWVWVEMTASEETQLNGIEKRATSCHWIINSERTVSLSCTSRYKSTCRW